MIRNIKDKVCKHCDKVYKPTSTSQKYCKNCAPIALAESARERKFRCYHSDIENYRARERIRSAAARRANPALSVYNGSKERASQLGKEFSISFSDLVIPDTCPVLGTKFMFKTPYSMSIDRIDNDKDYVKGNVQIISKKANSMKSDASIEELQRFAQWVLKTFPL